MHCRHTVPDWHRHVAEAGSPVPIYAACRLLIDKAGGKPATDPRSIACGYWGRQPACPFYAGPRAVGQEETRKNALEIEAESVDPTAVWPVRAPGAPDPLRLVTIGMALLAIGFLAVVVFGALVTRTKELPGWLLGVAAAAIGLSISGHVIGLIYAWTRR